MSVKSSGLLLDTHIWVWLNNGSPELTSETIALINAAGLKGQVCIPAISIWEVATLVEKKRLTLSMPITDWVKESLSQPGIELIPLSPEIAIESTQLPGNFHGDPADRLIVATARIQGYHLITRDGKILEYANQGYLKVTPA